MKLLLVMFCAWFLGLGVIYMCMYLVCEKPAKFFLRIKYLEHMIKKSQRLLKKKLTPVEVSKMEPRLLELFDIYSRYKFPGYVSLDYLFPGGEKTQKKLSPNELETSNKLFPYFKNYQNILSYKDGNITLVELAKRLI